MSRRSRSPVHAALTRAYRALAASAPVEKTIFGSPAGKKRIAARLATLLPSHRTYVEPFAGSAAVLFAKPPSDVEVINDADAEIAEAYRLVQSLTAAQLAELKKLDWTGDAGRFKRLIDASPSGDVSRLHRFLYLTHFSYGKMRGKSFSPNLQGIEATIPARVERDQPRLKGVKVYSGDYARVIEKYDGKDTVFFLDPPYAGYDADVGEGKFDEARFFEVLKAIRGKWVMTYGVRGKLPELLRASKFSVQQIRTPRTIRAMRNVAGPTMLTQLLVANFDLGDGWKRSAGAKPAPAEAEKSAPAAAEKSAHGGARLRRTIAAASPDDTIEKGQAFGTFGGSFHYAKRIVPLIPPHETYAEPFAGAAAVLYAKEPSDNEVLADREEDVVFLHRSVKAMTPATVAELARRFEWTVTEESFRKARDMTPKDEVARFYKLVFVRTHARDCRPDGTHPAKNHLGSTTNPEKYLRSAERLRDVTVVQQDYRKTLSSYDSDKTFFFIDPPYPGEWFDKDAVIDLKEFTDALSKLRGKFIAVLNPTPENVAAFKKVGDVFRLKVREASGTGGAKQAMRLFCANYNVRKSLDVDIEIVAPHAPATFAATAALIKNVDPSDERFVLGVVLEPEVVDAQGDIYSAVEVRAAAHRFMSDFRTVGLMHRERAGEAVKIVESYIAPAPFTVGDVRIRPGTWLMAVRVVSDELWARVKAGEFGGFSIGGSARRLPVEDAESSPEQPATTASKGATADEGSSAAHNDGKIVTSNVVATDAEGASPT